MTSPVIRVLRIIMPVVAIICVVLFVPWSVGCAWLAPLPDTVQEQVEDAIAHGLDGIIVYVERPGDAPSYYAAGWKNRDDKTPADPHALFKIASISKLYIAVAVAKLVSAERLSLDATLTELLPERAAGIANSDRITLRMLVQHRSGIPNFTDHPDYPWASPYKKSADTYELVSGMPADFEPDAKYRYSNTNYLLLGDILDRTLGYSHHQYIDEEILEPLELENTYHLLSAVNLDDLVSGYFVGYEPDIKRNDFIQPGGSMIATAEDVGIFLRALIDGSLLNEDEQAIYSSIYFYEHTGELPGYLSFAHYHADIDTVVIQFVNTSGDNSWLLSKVVYDRVVRILQKR